MIESRSQTGHRRSMTAVHSAAQAVSGLLCPSESGIKRIVAMGTLRGSRPCPDLKPKAESSPPSKKSQLEKNTAFPPATICAAAQRIGRLTATYMHQTSLL